MLKSLEFCPNQNIGENYRNHFSDLPDILLCDKNDQTEGLGQVMKNLIMNITVEIINELRIIRKLQFTLINMLTRC